LLPLHAGTVGEPPPRLIRTPEPVKIVNSYRPAVEELNSGQYKRLSKFVSPNLKRSIEFVLAKLVFEKVGRYMAPDVILSYGW
jgi:hypothetical protein